MASSMGGGGNQEMDPELQKEVMRQTQLAQFSNNVHSLSDVCWDKCVDKIYHKPDSKTQACVTNCVNRFLDTALFITNKLQSMDR